MATIQKRVRDALDPVVGSGRVYPVTTPQNFNPNTPFAVYVVETEGRDQTFCDAKGLVDSSVIVLFFGQDYDALWTIVRNAREAVLTIAKGNFAPPNNNLGSDEQYDDDYGMFVVSMSFGIFAKDF